MNPQDPLANLQPLRQPDLINWWPLAPGWWILLTVLVLGLAVTVYLLLRHYRKNAYRRQALAQLQDLQAQFEHSNDTNTYIASLNALLKSVALAAYPQREIASEHGDTWLAFLNRNLKQPDHFQQVFALAAYQQNAEQVDIAQLQRATRAWIKQHRVAK